MPGNLLCGMLSKDLRFMLEEVVDGVFLTRDEIQKIGQELVEGTFTWP